jgi:DNA-binding NarL/FixJ family response regulator
MNIHIGSRTKVLFIHGPGPLTGNFGALAQGEGKSTFLSRVVNSPSILGLITRLQPELILVDSPNSGSWVRTVLKVKAAVPHVRVLAVCGDDSLQHANKILRAGADGLILASESADEIIQAMRDVLAGRFYLSEEVLAARFLPIRNSKPPRGLSRRVTLNSVPPLRSRQAEANQRIRPRHR